VFYPRALVYYFHLRTVPLACARRGVRVFIRGNHSLAAPRNTHTGDAQNARVFFQQAVQLNAANIAAQYQLLIAELRDCVTEVRCSGVCART
jgi:hypothetical protein